MNIVAIVLAAGLSRRMGSQNKLLLELGKQSMVEAVVDRLIASPSSKVIVVVGHEADQIKSVISDKAVSIIKNDQYQTGMTSSIKAGVAQLPEDADAFMICLSDMPLLMTHHYAELIKAYAVHSAADECILRPQVNGKKGHPVIFHKAYKESIMQCTDTDGCNAVIQAHHAKCIYYDTEAVAYIRDVDTPQDKQWISTSYDRRKR